jgi:hypothetical protein
MWHWDKNCDKIVMNFVDYLRDKARRKEENTG